MRIEELKKLRNKIIDKIFKKCWRDVWFFPKYEQVKGFLGTQNIIFLGLNPSYGHFPSKYDKFFYKQLKNNKFKNAHITDLIKIKSSNKKINDLLENKKILKKQIEFLTKEIKIIDPQIIVTLGEKCNEVFKKNFKNKDISIMKIRHYSSIRFPKNKKLFSDEMVKLKKFYEMRRNKSINYFEASEEYKPKKVKLLLVGEAYPPNKKTYFYIPKPLKTKRSIEKDTSLPTTIFYHYFKNRPKTIEKYKELLNKLKQKGIFLIDILDKPIKIRNNKANLKLLIDEIPNLKNKIRSRGIKVEEENIIFLIARQHYLKELKKEFPNSKFIRWIDFRISTK